MRADGPVGRWQLECEKAILTIVQVLALMMSKYPEFEMGPDQLESEKSDLQGNPVLRLIHRRADSELSHVGEDFLHEC